MKRQEAQLLLGHRATRKHAKDCWNGRGNENLCWNDLQMYCKVNKSGTNRKLMYDFLLVVYSNFCHITYRIWEIWCETVQWPWNTPKIIDSRITWKLSCGHECKMFGRQWTNEAKIAILNDPTLIWRPLSSKPQLEAETLDRDSRPRLEVLRLRLESQELHLRSTVATQGHSRWSLLMSIKSHWGTTYTET